MYLFMKNIDDQNFSRNAYLVDKVLIEPVKISMRASKACFFVHSMVKQKYLYNELLHKYTAIKIN